MAKSHLERDTDLLPHCLAQTALHAFMRLHALSSSEETCRALETALAKKAMREYAKTSSQYHQSIIWNPMDRWIDLTTHFMGTWIWPLLERHKIFGYVSDQYCARAETYDRWTLEGRYCQIMND